MFAIVDIETTGGIPESAGITDIAILIHNGQQVVDMYHSLVNPEMPIPPFISKMTGISNAMVAHAPTFGELSERVHALLQDKVFVAHNVSFDHGFIRAHLKKNGLQLQVSKLCTVKLSRRFIPGYPSYSLGNICRSLGIEIEDRHRALGDAKATVQLFEKILANGAQDFVRKVVVKK
jgi:DNA polymerase-3 subunit epsilon